MMFDNVKEEHELCATSNYDKASEACRKLRVHNEGSGAYSGTAIALAWPRYADANYTVVRVQDIVDLTPVDELLSMIGEERMREYLDEKGVYEGRSKNLVVVRCLNYSDRKVACIKAVREVIRVGLKDAKDFIEGTTTITMQERLVEELASYVRLYAGESLVLEVSHEV